MFNQYYMAYLGISDENKMAASIYVSPQRSIPMCRRFTYQMIVTLIDGKLLYSMNNEWYKRIGLQLSGDVGRDLKDVYRYLSQFKSDTVKVRNMYRMTIKKQLYTEMGSVKVLDESLLKYLVQNKSEDEQQVIMKRKKEDIKRGSQYVIVEDDQIVSYARVSDIDYNGANLVVWTAFDYRKKGYGKKVVEQVVNWCQDQGLMPIYLVDKENIASVKLAKSIGFEIKSEEVTVVKEV